MKQAKFSPYAEIFWLEDINAVQIKWNKLHMSLDKFKEITDKVLQMISINKSSIWIADQYDSEGALNKKIIEFITNELVGDAVENYGVKLVLTIMPKQVGLSSLSAKRWMGEVQKMEAFTMANFTTLDDCKEWVRENT
jgi:hypothetical protein